VLGGQQERLLDSRCRGEGGARKKKKKNRRKSLNGTWGVLIGIFAMAPTRRLDGVVKGGGKRMGSDMVRERKLQHLSMQASTCVARGESRASSWKSSRSSKTASPITPIRVSARRSFAGLDIKEGGISDGGKVLSPRSLRGKKGVSLPLGAAEKGIPDPTLVWLKRKEAKTPTCSPTEATGRIPQPWRVLFLRCKGTKGERYRSLIGPVEWLFYGERDPRAERMS